MMRCIGTNGLREQVSGSWLVVRGYGRMTHNASPTPYFPLPFFYDLLTCRITDRSGLGFRGA